MGLIDPALREPYVKRFKLFFGIEGWPHHGYVTGSGQVEWVNLIVPVELLDDPSFCAAPDGEPGLYVAVTANLKELLAALPPEAQREENK